MSEQSYAMNVNSGILDENQRLTTNSQFNANNYLDTKLQDGENEKKVRLRVLPISVDNASPYVEIRIHSMKVSTEISKSGFKTYTCLNEKKAPNYDANVKCPLCEKGTVLFDKSKEARQNGDLALADTLKKEAIGYFGKTAYILRVIDRAHEDEGVKFWRFNQNSKGEGCMDMLRNIYKTRKSDYETNGRPDYNIFDLNCGRDIVLTITRVFDRDGKPTDKTAIQISDSSFETPLSTDVEKANAWIRDTKKWSDVYTVKSHDYLKIVADGLIPYFNKENGQFEGRAPKNSTASQVATTNSSVNTKIASDVAEKAREILNAPNPTNVQATVKSTVVQQPLQNTAYDAGDDLPF